MPTAHLSFTAPFLNSEEMETSIANVSWDIQIVEQPHISLLEKVAAFLRQEAAWYSTPFELSVTNPTLAVVLDTQQKIVCTATANVLSENNYWIGNVVVAKSHRRKRWASRIVASLLDYISKKDGPSTAVLLASPLGKSVYEHLGFVQVDSIVVSEYDRPPLPPPIPSDTKPHIPTKEQLSDAIDLYFRSSGMHRDQLLRDIFDKDGLCAVLEDNRGEVCAAAWGRRTAPYVKDKQPCIFLGPVVANSPDLAISVTAEILRMEYKHRKGSEENELCLRATVLVLEKGNDDTTNLAFKALGFAKEYDMPYMAKEVSGDCEQFGVVDFSNANRQYCAVAGWDFG